MIIPNTSPPLQVGACRSQMPNLRRRKENRACPKALVKISTSCVVEGTWEGLMVPSWMASRKSDNQFQYV